MKATDFLKRPVVGQVSGKPVRARRSWRGFFLALIAGGQTVVLNAKFRDGSLMLDGKRVGIVAGNEWTTRA